MTATLVCPQHIVDEIQQVARLEVETAGVLLASIVETPDGDIRILARHMRWVRDEAYLQREATSLGIASEGYVPALAEAEEINAACLWVHTHPGEHARPKPSCHDRIVDDQLADLFRLRSGSPYYGALIFSPAPAGLTFTGHLEREAGPKVEVGRLWQVGDRWRLTPAFETTRQDPLSLFDRNIRAFGSAIQNTIGDLRIVIVGCGGTGSAVGEQLVRLGARHFTLIDPDVLSASNTTRVYGSTPKSVGRSKAEVMAAHLLEIAPDAQIRTVDAMLTLEGTARRLIGCDIVFGCTDDNAGRLVLSRAATYLLLPVIDCGVLLSSDAAGTLVGIDGRVTTLVPGQACLVCRNRIDVARAGSELLTPDERVRRVAEGYAPALGQIEPAVVTFTTLVAAKAASMSKDSEVTVVGAGVIGLTTAMVLSSSYRVRIVADRFAAETDSVKATAIWHVYLVPETATILGWAQLSLEKFLELAISHPKAGIELVTGVELFRTQPKLVPSWAHIPPQFAMLTDSEIAEYNRPFEEIANQTTELLGKFPVRWGYPLKAPAVRMESYLKWMMDELKSKGVTFERSSVTDLSELRAGTVINCAGLGARELNRDFDFVPYKGQYFIVQTSSGAPTEYIGDDDFPTGMAYVIPRGGEVLVGGTAERGVDDLVPTANWNDVAARASTYVPWIRALANTETPRQVVGVRPVRPSGVRLERQILGKGDVVILNYGHGGSGFSLSWGCAREVLNLLPR